MPPSVSTSASIAVAVAARIGAEPQIFLDGHIDKDAAAFGHQHDAALGHDIGRLSGDIAPSKMTAPPRGLHQAGDGLQQRRLAGAIGAEDGDDLALRRASAKRRD